MVVWSVFNECWNIPLILQDAQAQVSDAPVNDLIQQVFIEVCIFWHVDAYVQNKSDSTVSFASGAYGVQYRKNNAQALVFVVSIMFVFGLVTSFMELWNPKDTSTL